MRVNDESSRVSGEAQRHRAGYARNESDSALFTSARRARLNTRGGRAEPAGCASVDGGRESRHAVNVLKVMNVRG